MFTADLDSESGLAEAWGSAANIIRDGAAQGVIRGVREGVNEAKTKHTFKSQTGELEESIEGNALGWRGDTFQGVMRAKAKHASFVEGGTGAHMIVGNPYLRFVWKGEPVIFRYVNHPGTHAMPFMGLAYQKAERVIVREVELAVERAQARLDR